MNPLIVAFGLGVAVFGIFWRNPAADKKELTVSPNPESVAPDAPANAVPTIAAPTESNEEPTP